jgi:hypothetical protein
MMKLENQINDSFHTKVTMKQHNTMFSVKNSPTKLLKNLEQASPKSISTTRRGMEKVKSFQKIFSPDKKKSKKHSYVTSMNHSRVNMPTLHDAVQKHYRQKSFLGTERSRQGKIDLLTKQDSLQ